jgi:hypothetical protein
MTALRLADVDERSIVEALRFDHLSEVKASVDGGPAPAA